jgi:hypothetical protein
MGVLDNLGMEKRREVKKIIPHMDLFFLPSLPICEYFIFGMSIESFRRTFNL